MRKTSGTESAAENGSTPTSSKIKPVDYPGAKSLIERITTSAKDNVVVGEQTGPTDIAQQAGKTIDSVKSLLDRLAKAK
ncbi:hypothetical protein PTTG_26667 [Puccinia triticina 1-1 BBBD Race 1]|uniref:Uncharacterized protein n=1 Tax=Puccinia triticina (isolate 1-1 / race 1 (BBBD)) TaxID=630390 RepID=A0A180GSP3_PUCT1|nr:hypothetical protein PTTG_26667 [Puccinia triticina 1-1 BBBD Race 1]